MSLDELEQDPFDPDEFVERLAWRTMGGSMKKAEDFDPMILHAAFEKTIKDLKELNLKIEKKVDRLEADCKDEENAHWQRVNDLQKHNEVAFTHFRGLDERINFVATKVVHLGDQLEGVNTPRTRAAEAQLLIKYFSEFLDHEQPQSNIFTNPAEIHIAADIIQKLYLIAQELPSGEKFEKARDRITIKYTEIEKTLLDEFRNAHRVGDKRKMKRLAVILANFKGSEEENIESGYNQCIDIFIEESQKNAFLNKDVFDDIPPLCERTNAVIIEVFANPEAVMSKLVLNIYHQKLQEHLAVQLAETSDMELYLQRLHALYNKTTQLSAKLSSYKLGSGDANFLNKVTKYIFSKYIDSYIEIEKRFLREKCIIFLHRYYDSKNHQKKVITSGGISDLRRDLQNVLGAKANINLGPTIENYGGETFLSQEVAINILQETKLALKRCSVLCSRTDQAANATQIFELLVNFLCIEHIDYAIELGLQAIPLADPKQEPAIYFFDVVGQANTIFHLFEKQFSDHLIPLVQGTPKQSECIHRKREVMETMENKLDMGLDRSIAALVGWIRQLLKQEQKISDFKPEDESVMQMFSPACGKVVKYIKQQLDAIHFGLDGKNVDAALTEFGVRFHRVVFEHLQQYQYNSMGAMLAICDVNEYRKCTNDFGIPLVTQLFDSLHSLCNLLVVVPDNLKQVCTGDQMAGFEKSVMLSFISLRADYKTARLANHFK